jgi:hypothetical protein
MLSRLHSQSLGFAEKWSPTLVTTKNSFHPLRNGKDR